LTTQDDNEYILVYTWGLYHLSNNKILSPPLFSSSNEIDIFSHEIANIISYPNLSAKEYFDRLNEISSFGVTHFLPGGRTRIGKINIAGKGCVSIVLKVRTKAKICALKIRRTDANRHSMEREYYLHKIANSADVGPRLFQSSKNLITMQFIDGLSLVDWIRNNDITADEARNLAESILEQCYRLDMEQIDHGQLSCLNHHIIVSNNNDIANVIDFESSSTTRKPSNVTTAAQSLFLSGRISFRISQLVKVIQKEKIIQLLKTYKRNPSRINFDNIMNIIC
jgi:putative serine/threonine protein kinase